MISTIKQHWNRITILFLTTSIVQVIIEYGKIIIDKKKISFLYILFKISLLSILFSSARRKSNTIEIFYNLEKVSLLVYE
jgi:hypothetical protein